MDTKKTPLWKWIVGIIAAFGVFALVMELTVNLFFLEGYEIHWKVGIFWGLILFLLFYKKKSSSIT